MATKVCPLSTPLASVGIDIGKDVFHVVGLGSDGKTAFRWKIKRLALKGAFEKVPPCIVGMEACLSAHFVSRMLRALGHEPRIIPAIYVKPFVKGQKNDYNDAEAIAEAALRPNLRMVREKTQDQLDLQACHRVRSRLVSRRTAAINQIRAFLIEQGIAVRAGTSALRKSLFEIPTVSKPRPVPKSSARERHEPVCDAVPDSRPANRCFERFQQHNRAAAKEINNVRPTTRVPIVDNWNENIEIDDVFPRHDTRFTKGIPNPRPGMELSDQTPRRALMGSQRYNSKTASESDHRLVYAMHARLSSSRAGSPYVRDCFLRIADADGSGRRGREGLSKLKSKAAILGYAAKRASCHVFLRSAS